LFGEPSFFFADVLLALRGSFDGGSGNRPSTNSWHDCPISLGRLEGATFSFVTFSLSGRKIVTIYAGLGKGQAVRMRHGGADTLAQYPEFARCDQL